MSLNVLSRRKRAVLAASLGLLPLVAACAPNVVPGNPTDFSVNTAAGQHLRWNPCAPVHWKADLRNAPAGTLTPLKAAVANLSAKSGITFVYDGAASYIPQKGSTAQPSSLVVSFARPPGRPSASNYLTGGTNVGYGGFEATGVNENGKPVYQISKGFVVIDADRYPFLSTKIRNGVLEHELGHAVGLNHARFTSEIMYPTISNASPDNYSSGDLAGLRMLGRTAGCIS
jgi:hypothetical protein